MEKPLSTRQNQSGLKKVFMGAGDGFAPPMKTYEDFLLLLHYPAMLVQGVRFGRTTLRI